MSVVERLRRTGQYVGDVASRSVGVEYLKANKQANRIRKEIGQPSISNLETGGVIFSLTLFPATILSLTKEDNPSDSKIGSKFVAGVNFLSALAIDISSLVVPIAVEEATHNPLPLLGLLGKPLCNAVVWVASDIVDARAFRKKDSPKANSGTYGFLENIYNESYEPDLKSGIIRDSQGKVAAVVTKEEVCARTGGSCMELTLPKREGEEIWIEFAHVTKKGCYRKY